MSAAQLIDQQKKYDDLRATLFILSRTMQPREFNELHTAILDIFIKATDNANELLNERTGKNV